MSIEAEEKRPPETPEITRSTPFLAALAEEHA